MYKTIFIVVALLLALGFVFYTGYRYFSIKEVANIPEQPPERITLEVFNGLRDGNATLKVQESLRRDGRVDVVTIEKGSSSIYPRTVILDRKGDREKMLYLAYMLGLPEDRILIQKSNQRLDATLVVGVDWEIITRHWN